MKAEETRKISENFKKNPTVHQRNMIDALEDYGSRHTTEEICSVCGLSRFEINWLEKKGIEDNWCKETVNKNINNISAGKAAAKGSAEKTPVFAMLTHFLVTTQRLLSKLRF